MGKAHKVQKFSRIQVCNYWLLKEKGVVSSSYLVLSQLRFDLVRVISDLQLWVQSTLWLLQPLHQLRPALMELQGDQNIWSYLMTLLSDQPYSKE